MHGHVQIANNSEKEDFSLSHEQMKMIKQHLNLSNKKTIDLAADLSYCAGTRIVDPGLKQSITEENVKFEDIFEISSCEDGSQVVTCTDLGEFIHRVSEGRGHIVEPDYIKLGMDGGRGLSLIHI